MRDGTPSEWTLRRWRNLGLSGAKWIWGGEAVAVLPEGRANPNQLYYRSENERGLAELYAATTQAHKDKYGSTEDLLFGLQLTHSGRFCRPNEHSILEPRIVHSHPILDSRFNVDASNAMISDGELDDLIERFVRASVAVQKIGFDFVDIKHCHSYLLNELLGAKTRAGNYGGSFENRTRFLREVVRGIQRDAPGLVVGVRISVFDQAPSITSEGGCAIDQGVNFSDFHFGLIDKNGVWDLEEPMRFLRLCRELGVTMINVTGGSPYYCAHLQRPAAYPPIDSTESKQDPLIGVTRQIQAVQRCKREVPQMPLVGSAYSYLQEYLPHVAQAQVREGHVDFVGLGRVVLSYPTLPDDVLTKGELTRGRICRTFSDCTNGPRMGFISGCFPLDPVYKDLPEWQQIRERKKAITG